MSEFPDTIPAEISSWATKIPRRNPEFKVHAKESLANLALGQRDLYESFAKYELVNGEWVLRFKYEPREDCDRCHRLYSEIGKRTWRMRSRPTYAKPQYSSIVVCVECATTLDRMGVANDS